MMIWTIILFSYLFTCCTHLVTLAKITTTTSTIIQPAPIVIHQQPHLPSSIYHHQHQIIDPLAAVAATATSTFSSQSSNNNQESLFLRRKRRDDRDVLEASEAVVEGDERDSIGRESPKEKMSKMRQEEESGKLKVHKLMSEQDLRRTFQVDSHDKVPEYEILTISNKLAPEQEEQLLAAAALDQAESIEIRKNLNHNKMNEHNYDKFNSNEAANEASKQDNHLNIHHPVVKLKLSTFGKQFKLRLKRNADFQQRIKDMKMFIAESNQDGSLRYIEVKQQRKHHDDSNKMPLESHQQANHTTYHDEENLAALLIDHDKRTGRLQLDGTIGNDFVIKPLPEASARALELAEERARQLSLNNSNIIFRENLKDLNLNDNSNFNDDNNNNNLREYVANRIVNENTSNNNRKPEVSHHVVYRQKPSSESSSSEHKHSFMIAPKDQLLASAGTMEQVALNFNSERLKKRSMRGGGGGGGDNKNVIEKGEDKLVETDYLHDPLGGQFHLEPGLVNLTSSTGPWSLHLHNYNHRRKFDNLLQDENEFEDEIDGDDYLENNPNNLINSSNNNSNNNSTSYDKRKNYNHYLKTNKNATTNSRVKINKRFKRHLQHRARNNAGAGQRVAASQVRRKRQAPDTVWPEVLLVVDYDSFLLHGGDSRDVKRYFVSFWNGVDLRYKLLVHPHIRISLAGMIVAKDRDATPYLERNRLRAPNADAVDAAGALTDMGKYLYREDRLPTYDLAVVITKLDMCRRRLEGGRCNRGTAGFAYVGGACVVNKRLEKVNSVAIIEDSGGFSGIIVAAHEVGHLLGCVHDGSPPPSYLGGPGATHCPWEDGFIMSDLRHTERGFRWSQCSVEQFKHFLNGETATCLYNYPHESQMLHRLSPGTMLSLDEQCKRDRGTNACFKDARVCAQLFCFDSASGYCVSYRPAAEGSPCGEGQVCRNGKCVGEIENIIPDYTHQTQTIAVAPNHNNRQLRQHQSLVSSTRLSSVDKGLRVSSTSLTPATSSASSSASSSSVPIPHPAASSASSSSLSSTSLSSSSLPPLTLASSEV